jgi:endoglucanase
MKSFVISGSLGRKSFLFFMAAMIVCAAFVDSSALGRRQLHCSAGKILDEAGNTVILRGFGLGNWLMPEGYMMTISSKAYDAPREMEAGVLDLLGNDTASAREFWRLYYSNYISEKDVCSMKAWGTNSVRISFNANVIQPRSGQPATPPYKYDAMGWEILDNFIAWCAKYQMWVIWDMHGAPGGQSRDNICDSDGEARLWTDAATYWPRAIDCWMKIVDRYKDNDWIIGYNLLNEPLLKRYGFDVGLYMKFCKQVTDSIRKIDNKGLLFIDGDAYAQDFSLVVPPWDAQIVYDFHCYPPVTWNNPFGLDPIRNQYGTPLWHGETGEDNNTTYTNFVTKMETYVPPIGWAFWQLKKFNATRQPYDVIKTTGFSNIINYWNNGGAKPTPANAKTWLYEMALKTHSDSSSVSFMPDVVQALKLNPNGKCTVPVQYQESLKPTAFSMSRAAVSSASVAISFTLPYSSPVKLSIFDANGKLQKTVVDRTMAAGKQSVSWDRTNASGKNVAAGVYVFSFTMNGKSLSKHFVLAR